MAFKTLLERWQAQPTVTKSATRYEIKLDIDDAARVEALVALFPALDSATVIGDLLHEALDKLEAAMPYEPGDTVIQEDEFGDPIYEDRGLTPDYVRLVREQREKLG